ncbi:MAG: SIS domain-containing protein [Bacteroidales bacterium]
MNKIIPERIKESIDTKASLLSDDKLLESIDKVGQLCIQAYKKGNKILFAGNGGSASDAQHLAAELSGRFGYDRPPLYAEALHVNTSYLTAVANDYSFEEVYARLIAAQGKAGDVLFALSTSGNSPNIIKAIHEARKQGMIVVGLTGETGGNMKTLCDYLLNMPSVKTARVQECHILIGHIICEIIENELFPRV